MVNELCSENCEVVSMDPRISFSLDTSQTGGVIPVEGQQQQHPLRSNSSSFNSTIDFDFCVHESSEHESSSADELFSDGILLPTEIKKKKKKKKNHPPSKQTNQQEQPPPPHHHHSLPPFYAANTKNSKKVSTKDAKDLMNNEEVFEKQSSNSFWSFKRSSSCGSGCGSSLCPLSLLSRSHSTGSSSSPSVKKMPLSKESASVKQNSQKQRFSNSFGSNNHQLKRSHGGAYANSARVSHVLNVPSLKLFGFGSIFSTNRDKSKK